MILFYFLESHLIYIYIFFFFFFWESAFNEILVLIYDVHFIFYKGHSTSAVYRNFVKLFMALLHYYRCRTVSLEFPMGKVPLFWYWLLYYHFWSSLFIIRKNTCTEPIIFSRDFAILLYFSRLILSYITLSLIYIFTADTTGSFESGFVNFIKFFKILILIFFFFLRREW